MPYLRSWVGLEVGRGGSMVGVSRIAANGWLSAGVVALALASASPAHAQAPTPPGGGDGDAMDAARSAADADAQRHFTAGQAYFDRGAYEDAAHEFREAYELSHRTLLLFNIHLAEEHLGHFQEAADALEQYLRLDPDAPDRERLEARLANLRERAAQQAAALEVERARAAAASAPRAEEHPNRHVPLSAIASWSVAGAALVSFVVAGSMAIAEDRDLASSCGSEAGRTCTDDEVAPLHRRTVTADVSLGLALGAGVTGLVFYFVQRDRAEPAPVSVSVSPSGASVSYETRFSGVSR